MALTAALLPIPAALPPALAEPDEGETETVVVDSITPDVVDEDATLRVSGEVTNTTDEELSEVSVRMRYSRHPFGDRGELNEFSSGEGWQPDASGPDEEISTEMLPGTSRGYALSTDADDLGLSGYGVYPMVIEAVDGDDEVVGAQYTFLPYLDDDDDTPELDLAWVWPLMSSPQRADDDTFLTGALPQSLNQHGRLGRLLATGAQVPVDFDPGDGDLVEDLGLQPSPEDEEEGGEGEEGPAESPEDEVATDEETAPAEPTASPTDGEEDPDEENGNGDDNGGNDGNGEEDDGAGEDTAPSRAEGVPVTWAVDPGTLDDIVRAASEDFEVLDDVLAVPAESEPVRHAHEADESAQVWLREARRLLPADTVVATPYASPDLASMLRNDIDADAEASLRLGREATMEALELVPEEGYALPPEGLMDDGVHELFSENGATRYLLDGDAMPSSSWLSTAPSAQAALPSPTGDGEEDGEDMALVRDPGLAEVLSMPSQTSGESTLALQRFAAETAMIADENSGDDRVILASPDPDWDPGENFASGVLEATDSLPWLAPEDLADVELPPEEEREDTRSELIYPDSAYDTELSSTYLGQIQDVNRDVRMFNSILVEDNDPFRPALLRLSSAYWRDEEAMAGAMRTLVAQDVREGLDSVRIIPGEPVTLASRTGITGILVANDLEDETVHVHLSVYSENSERLSVEDYTDSFELAPGARTTVYVPLSARVNGLTELRTSLHNAAGEPINTQDATIPVNATGLGTQALLISGIGVLILIAALAPRALRKWARAASRKSSKQAAAAGAGPGGAGTGAAGAGDTAGVEPVAGSEAEGASGPEDKAENGSPGEAAAGSGNGTERSEDGDLPEEGPSKESPVDEQPADGRPANADLSDAELPDEGLTETGTPSGKTSDGESASEQGGGPAADGPAGSSTDSPSDGPADPSPGTDGPRT